MKAVAYHADSHYPDGKPIGDTYKRLFKGWNKNSHGHGYSTVHVTLEGHEGWGDENFYVSGLDPKNVMLNREIAFCEFLKGAQDDVYFFTEPDYRIHSGFPPLRTDVALIYRSGDGVPLNPSWRLATPKALPLFELFRDETKAIRPGVGHDWHCDSEGFKAVWKKMGCPDRCEETFRFMGLSVELRKFSLYVKGNTIFGKNYSWAWKKELLAQEC